MHLPDYREKTNPLDTVGLILFGSGVALLSYVLEVFGEHTLTTGGNSGLARNFHSASHYAYGASTPAEPRIPCRRSNFIQDTHLPRLSCRQLRHSIGHRWHPIFISSAVSGRYGLHPDSIRPNDDAASNRRDDFETGHAENPGAFRLSRRADFKHAS